MRKMNESANLHKEYKKLLEKWIDLRSEIEALQWFEEHGEELMVLASEPPVTEFKETEIELRPPLAVRGRYEFWQSVARHGRRKAG